VRGHWRLHQDDVRKLLAIESGYASDLAVTVFHDSEVVALLPEISKAFPWPVHIITREDVSASYKASFLQQGTLVSILWFPALITFGLYILVVMKQRLGQRSDIGLYKALGWTTRDIMVVYGVRLFFLLFPFFVFGFCLAYLIALGPYSDIIGTLIFGWRSISPPLFISWNSLLLVFGELVAGVLIPICIITMWPLAQVAVADPSDFLVKGGGHG